MSPVDDYLADLSAALGDRLPPSVHTSRLREARAHLLASALDVGEVEAVQRYGRSRAVANDLVREHRGYGTKSAWSLALAAGAALAVTFAVPNVWMAQGGMTATGLQFDLSVWLPFLAVLVFAARCFRTRRWLVLPAVTWAAAGIALVFVVPALFPARSNARERVKNVQDYRAALAIWNDHAQEVAQWRAGRAPEYIAPIAWRPRAFYYIAGIPLPFVLQGPTTYDVQHFGNGLSGAERNWMEYGDAWAKEVELRRQEWTDILAATEAGNLRPPVPLAAVAELWLVDVGQIAAVLLTFNALALLLGRISDRSWVVHRSRV